MPETGSLFVYPQPRFQLRNLCASDENVVDGDVDQLDDVTDEAHDQDYCHKDVSQPVFL